MSWTFYKNVILPDTVTLNLGTDSDATLQFDGTNIVLSRAVGTPDLVFDGSLTICNSADEYSRFGPAPTSTIVAPTDAIDRALFVKTSNTTSGNKRAVIAVTQFTGSSATSGAYNGINAFSISSGSGNMTSTATVAAAGGNLRNRYMVRHEGSGTVAMASSVTGFVTSTGTNSPITDSATFHAESPTLTAGTTWSTHSALWIRGGAVLGTLTTRYGIRIEDLNGGSTKYAIAIESDTDTLVFGGGHDASIVYDGTNLNINPKVVGTGYLDILGKCNADNFVSDATTGTEPYACASTTLNTNLNADQVDSKHVGTSGSTIPLLDGTNTWTGTQGFAGADVTGISETATGVTSCVWTTTGTTNSICTLSKSYSHGMAIIYQAAPGANGSQYWTKIYFNTTAAQSYGWDSYTGCFYTNADSSCISGKLWASATGYIESAALSTVYLNLVCKLTTGSQTNDNVYYEVKVWE